MTNNRQKITIKKRFTVTICSPENLQRENLKSSIYPGCYSGIPWYELVPIEKFSKFFFFISKKLNYILVHRLSNFGFKKSQKWIEQVQKWVLGARRVKKIAKYNINKAFNALLEIIYAHSYDK